MEDKSLTEQNEKKPGNNIHLLYLALIALLVGGLVFTSLKLKKSTETIIVTEKERDDVKALKAELDLQYAAALQDIENFKAENAGLDSLLNVKEQELQAKKAKIEQLLAQVSANKKDKAALAEAQMLIAQMQNDKIALQRSVDSLMTENKQLYVDKENLNTQLTTTTQEKENLNTENTQMRERIDKASILSTSNIIATPIRTTKKGKEEEVKKAKDAQKLKLCFDLLQNKIAPKGPTEMAVRIISVDGSTIQIESLGSGTLTESTTGNTVPYTYTISPEYDNETKQVCSYWNQNYNFGSGKYSVEVYQKGFLIGQSSFTMK